MFIRYELYIGDEPQHIGFIQGLDELQIDTSEYVKPFDDSMPIPKLHGMHTSSWFTEYGEKTFLSAIRQIIYLFEDNGLFNVRRITVDSLDDIIYEDEYQAIINLEPEDF